MIDVLHNLVAMSVKSDNFFFQTNYGTTNNANQQQQKLTTKAKQQTTTHSDWSQTTNLKIVKVKEEANQDEVTKKSIEKAWESKPTKNCKHNATAAKEQPVSLGFDRQRNWGRASCVVPRVSCWSHRRRLGKVTGCFDWYQNIIQGLLVLKCFKVLRCFVEGFVGSPMSLRHIDQRSSIILYPASCTSLSVFHHFQKTRVARGKLGRFAVGFRTEKKGMNRYTVVKVF